jgi:hypothetical protein
MKLRRTVFVRKRFMYFYFVPDAPMKCPAGRALKSYTNLIFGAFLRALPLPTRRARVSGRETTLLLVVSRPCHAAPTVSTALSAPSRLRRATRARLPPMLSTDRSTSSSTETRSCLTLRAFQSTPPSCQHGGSAPLDSQSGGTFDLSIHSVCCSAYWFADSPAGSYCPSTMAWHSPE